MTIKPLKAVRGLIHQTSSFEHFELTRLQASSKLAPFVENYWVINWDLTGKAPYRQKNLPHPSQHLVIDPSGQSGIFGITSGKFVYTLENKGVIFGVKFWPGAFHCFYQQEVSKLSNSLLSIQSVFDQDEQLLEQQLLHTKALDDFSDNIERMLIAAQPTLSAKSHKARLIVEYIEQNPLVCSSALVAEKFAMTNRTLQRLFDSHIGMPPTWVIQRYRMLDALNALHSGSNVSLTQLAHQLGFFDQAHFSKAFCALVGVPPSCYNFTT
jgi:AraC-like DNA-binding protein